MSTGNRMNTLLVELLIVIFFFMLGSTVLMQVFGRAHSLSEEAGELTRALAEAQSAADILYGSTDPEEALEEMGFAVCEGAQEDGIRALLPDADGQTLYVHEGDGYQLAAGVEEPEIPEDAAGGMRRMAVSILLNGRVRATLPCSRYVEGTA